MSKATDPTRTPKLGDVVEDSYGNPAVVLSPTLIIQTCGSDEGNTTCMPRLVRYYSADDPNFEWALNKARKAWRTSPSRFRNFVR